LNGAQQSCERELALDRNSVEAVTGLVAVDLYRKRSKEARTRIDAFLMRHPHDASALVLAAKVYKELAQPAKVEELLTRALAADPANPSTYALLAEVYISQKRLPPAQENTTQIRVN